MNKNGHDLITEGCSGKTKNLWQAVPRLPACQSGGKRYGGRPPAGVKESPARKARQGGKTRRSAPRESAEDWREERLVEAMKAVYDLRRSVLALPPESRREMAAQVEIVWIKLAVCYPKLLMDVLAEADEEI